MTRSTAALAFVLSLCAPAAAIVGGGAPAIDGAGRSIVMIVGSRGNSCSGTALARDLVLTAAHCVLSGADYKLVEFDAAHQPTLKDIAGVTRHPKFDVNAVLRHIATADVALLKLAAPVKNPPALLAPADSPVAVGDRLIIAGYGLAALGDGKSGGSVRTAALVATGQPGTLQIRLFDPSTKGERPGLGACTGDSGGPAFREVNGRLMVIGVVSWSTGPQLSAGCGGLTGVTPLTRYRDWIVETAGKLGAPLGP